MLLVLLLTRGSPDQLTGGHLYHRRMAERAGLHGARLDVVPVRSGRNPFAHPADVVLVDSLAAAEVAPWVLAGKHRGRSLAAIVHQQPGGVDTGPRRAALRRRLDLALYRRCAGLLVPSASVADELSMRFGVPADRIAIAAPGRDAPARSARAPLDARDGRRIAVLCVANWLPNKGIGEVLEAVAGLSADAATLHLVGRPDADPRYRDHLVARIGQPDLADRVVVHGALPSHELGAWYAAADVFALASRAETYGTVYAEALTAGLPIVGWRAGNVVNLVADGVEGSLCEPGDVPGLSSALERLATDDAWRATLAAAARRRAATLPTWDATAEAFFAALRRLADR